jgi:hypothetical protein
MSFIRPERMSKNIASESYWSQCDLHFIYIPSFFFIVCRTRQLIRLISSEFLCLWMVDGWMVTVKPHFFLYDRQSIENLKIKLAHGQLDGWVLMVSPVDVHFIYLCENRLKIFYILKNFCNCFLQF